MKLGFVGLGKMGASMVERLLEDHHEVVVYNRSPEPVARMVQKGAIGTGSLKELCENLKDRKVIWLMVPSGTAVDETILTLKNCLKSNDIVIDGGNSNYKDTIVRAALLREKNIHFLDCGTSGGVWGLKNGYSLMSGGEKEPTEYVMPVFRTLAPVGGYTYCGESGAGHFVKMVHNGIEYGLMQSYAEGLELLQKSPFNIDLLAVTSGWREGSVVRSWLLELIVNELGDDPHLDRIKGFVADSGEGRWAVETAVELGVPAPIMATSLFTRFQSREPDSFAMKVLAALRNQFGGHAVVRE
jgi:6-phosphogluconate dehydrogenase